MGQKLQKVNIEYEIKPFRSIMFMQVEVPINLGEPIYRTVDKFLTEYHPEKTIRKYHLDNGL